MKQLNIAFEDSLYESIVKMAINRDLSPTDLIRSTLRNITPEMQKVVIDYKNKSIEAEGKLMIVSTEESKIWFAELYLPKNDKVEDSISGIDEILHGDLYLHFEDGRSGSCRIISVGFGVKTRITAIGIAGLNK